MKRLVAILLSVLSLAATARADTIRLFSYDPADAETRNATGPVTLQFRQGLLHATVMNLRSTEAPATTELSRVPDNAIGPGGLARVLGKDQAWRDLYRVGDKGEGQAMLQALCQTPKGWLAIGRPRYGGELSIYVIGAGTDGAPKLCRTLNFSFRGEWRVPKTGSFDPNLLDHTRRGPTS